MRTTRLNHWVLLGALVVAWGMVEGHATAQQPPRQSWSVAPAPLPLPPTNVAEPSAGQSPRNEVPSPVETIEDAWRTALRADQRLAASRWNVTSAESTRAAAQAEQYPALHFGSDYYALSDQPTFLASLPMLGTAELPILDKSSVGFQALVTQPIYTFGRISNGISAADEALKASQSDCHRTALDIKMNVAEIFILTLRAGRIVEVAEAKALSLEAHTRDVGAFYDRGLVSRNDLLAAQVALADSRQQALQARNGLRVAQAAYNRALGRALDCPVRLAELNAAGDPGDVAQLTNMAMQMRPELAALAAQARALQDQAASERAKQAPQVGLMGGYVYQQNQYVDPNGLAVVGLGLQWTPIDSGRVSHRASSLCERAEAVIRMRKDAESMIALEVRQRWFDLQTARQRVEVTRQATTQADENIRVARDRYQQQVGTNTEVLDAETLRVQTYTSFYNSTYEAALAELRLRRAIGNL